MLAAASASTTVVARLASTSSGATPWPAGRCTEADTFTLAHASLESMSLDAMRAVLRGLIAPSADAANELEYFVALRVAQAVAQSADPVEQHRPQHDGTVMKWTPADGEDQALWKVIHDDGDQEDLDKEQLAAAIALFGDRRRRRTDGAQDRLSLRVGDAMPTSVAKQFRTWLRQEGDFADSSCNVIIGQIRKMLADVDGQRFHGLCKGMLLTSAAVSEIVAKYEGNKSAKSSLRHFAEFAAVAHAEPQSLRNDARLQMLEGYCPGATSPEADRARQDLWSALQQEGWTMQQTGERMRKYFPPGVTSENGFVSQATYDCDGLEGPAVKGQAYYYRNLGAVVRYLRQTGWHGWQPHQAADVQEPRRITIDGSDEDGPPLRIGDDIPATLIESFIGWAESGLALATLQGYAAKIRQIVRDTDREEQDRRFPALRVGMLVSSDVVERAVCGSKTARDDKSYVWSGSIRKLQAFLLTRSRVVPADDNMRWPTTTVAAETDASEAANGFQTGDRVEVLFDVIGTRRSKFYPGKVTRLVSPGLYTVAFDDGDRKDCWVDDMRALTVQDAAGAALGGARERRGIPDIVLGPGVDCCICKDPFDTMEPDTRICQLACKHAMCAECIEAWFATSDLGHGDGGPIRSRKTCPECRRGFASLRKSDTATLADIKAMQRFRKSEKAPPKLEPVRSRHGSYTSSGKARDGAQLRCEQCSAVIDGSYGTGRFCDRTCKNTWCKHAGQIARRVGQCNRPKKQQLSGAQSASLQAPSPYQTTWRTPCPNDGRRGGGGALSRSGWTQREDHEIKRMVEEDGAGNWDAKAHRLGTGRTGNAAYQRWHCYLQTYGTNSDNEERRPQKRRRQHASNGQAYFKAGETVRCPACDRKMCAPAAARALRCANSDCRATIAPNL